MKYWTRKNGSQRASREQNVSILEVAFESDGSTPRPILWFRVGDVWHAIEFEDESEAKILMSTAAHIYRGIK